MKSITNEQLVRLLRSHLGNTVAYRKFRVDIGESSVVITVPTEIGGDVVGTIGLPVDVDEAEEELYHLEEAAWRLEREEEKVQALGLMQVKK